MEQFLKKYPVGIQTFDKVIKGGYVYIDKTELIFNMVHTGEYYLLSRPRRFGKSLLISTLQAYFEGRKDLFRGLAIERLETDWEKYPVFRLDFSGNKYTEEGDLLHVANLFLHNYEEIYGAKAEEQTFGSRFQGLLRRAMEQTGRQCVVLIDEYDKPLTDTIGNTAMQEKNREVLQGLYGVLKNADANIRFAMLTGVTRYGKLGIFSAANNPNDISTAPYFSSLCGITEDELQKYFDEDTGRLSIELGVTKGELLQMLKRKYDGYHFSSRSVDVYNPFSILNAFKNRQLDNYWFATGTPTYLALMLKKAGFNPSTLEGEIKASSETLSSFGSGENNLVAALYQSGYLTIKDFDGKFYTLGIPNEEVADGLTSYLIPEYCNTSMGRFDPEISRLGELITVGDANGMMEQLQTIMEEIPFENNEPKMMEAHFRNMVYLMVRATGYKTYVEMSKLGGRIDICFETDQYAYIIECKRNLSAKEALAQIDVKNYAKRLSATGKQLFKIGANFSTGEKNLVEWVVEE